ncbi:MAG: hypothetical protein HY22_13195, partial [[Candidatus Thermochlorobacteriaceae] bacterium GBChlB]
SSAWYNRGNVLANIGRLEDAIESYRMTLKYEPQDVPSLFNIATAFEELGDYDQAITHLKKCLAIDMDYADAWYALACCYDLTDEPQIALVAINRAIRLVPDCTDYLHAKAEIEYSLGNIEESLLMYRKALKLDNENIYAWYDYAATLLDAEQPKEAVKAFRRVLEIDPSLADAHFDLACAYKALGDTENALRSLRDAFALDSNKRDLFKSVFPEWYRHKSIREALGIK